MLIILAQVVGILIPLIGVIALMQKKSQNKITLRLILTNMACMVMNSGYLMFVIAGDDSAAV